MIPFFLLSLSKCKENGPWRAPFLPVFTGWWVAATGRRSAEEEEREALSAEIPILFVFFLSDLGEDAEHYMIDIIPSSSYIEISIDDWVVSGGSHKKVQGFLTKANSFTPHQTFERTLSCFRSLHRKWKRWIDDDVYLWGRVDGKFILKYVKIQEKTLCRTCEKKMNRSL